jgi:hypothetical protein
LRRLSEDLATTAAKQFDEERDDAHRCSARSAARWIARSRLRGAARPAPPPQAEQRHRWRVRATAPPAVAGRPDRGSGLRHAEHVREPLEEALPEDRPLFASRGDRPRETTRSPWPAMARTTSLACSGSSSSTLAVEEEGERPLARDPRRPRTRPTACREGDHAGHRGREQATPTCATAPPKLWPMTRRRDAPAPTTSCTGGDVGQQPRRGSLGRR